MTELRDKPDFCYESGCPLAHKARGFTLGSGDPETAKMALNLEAPGRDEIQFMLEPVASRDFWSTREQVNAELAIRQRDYSDLPMRFLRFGAPVVGRSGAQLNTWSLPASGLRRADLFIDNTLRCLPPKSKSAAYPTGDERKQAEQCCRHYDRWDKFRPDTQLVTLHPAGLMREITPLPLQIEDFRKARDFVAQGRRVMVLVGGKAFKAFMRFSENVTKIRGHYRNLPPDWSDTYKQAFDFVARARKAKKAPPQRPEVLAAEPCKSHKRYKGKRAPTCGCEPCWIRFENERSAQSDAGASS